jgi:hypothetical protein
MYLFIFHLLELCTKVLSPLTFFVKTFLILFQRIRSRHQILCFFIPILKIFGKNFWGGHISTFWKLISQTSSKHWKTFFFMCNRIQFCIHPWVRTFNIFKNCKNRCSAHGADPHPHPSTAINIYCTNGLAYCIQTIMYMKKEPIHKE